MPKMSNCHSIYVDLLFVSFICFTCKHYVPNMVLFGIVYHTGIFTHLNSAGFIYDTMYCDVKLSRILT